MHGETTVVRDLAGDRGDRATGSLQAIPTVITDRVPF